MKSMPEFPDYDPSIAEVAAGYQDETGIGAFLGITTDEVGPGSMRCLVAVRDDLLNPFGVMHGAALSALCDHMLGAVCFPVIPRHLERNPGVQARSPRAGARRDRQRQCAIMSMSKKVVVVRIDAFNRRGDNTERLVALAQGTVSLQTPQA